ncbi:hypothetical protein oki361_24480 [Helicobacter pylori]
MCKLTYIVLILINYSTIQVSFNSLEIVEGDLLISLAILLI